MMKSALIVCLLMLVAGIVLALSAARIGWFVPFAFCGTFPFLIVIGMMALCAVACLVMSFGVCRKGRACWRCRPAPKS